MGSWGISKTPRMLPMAGLALAAAVALGAAAPTPALAESRAINPHAAFPVIGGVSEAFQHLQLSVEDHWQTIVIESEMERQRQLDAEADRQKLASINARGEEAWKNRQEAEAAAAAEKAAAEEAARAKLEAQEKAAQQEAEAADPAEVQTIAEKVEEDAPAPLSAEPGVPRYWEPYNVLRFLGHEVAFAQGNCLDTTAPDGYASTWLGDGSVSDNGNTYFIGHNPGVFAPVMDLEIGDAITVWDGTGASRTYYVYNAVYLPKNANYFDYESIIAPWGESVTLQTCCPGDASVRCVMAR